MKQLIDIQNELKAPKGQKNTFGNYKYRSCEDILEALKPLLYKHNCFLTITDSIKLVGERYYVEAKATIHNAEGQSIFTTALARESDQKKGMDDAQITGSSSSYARKYALNGLFAIDDTKDPDTRDNSDNKAPKHDSQKKWENDDKPWFNPTNKEGEITKQGLAFMSKIEQQGYDEAVANLKANMKIAKSTYQWIESLNK